MCKQLFIGANGADLSAACNPSQLVDRLTQVINTYKPEGLDFDIECDGTVCNTSGD